MTKKTRECEQCARVTTRSNSTLALIYTYDASSKTDGYIIANRAKPKKITMQCIKNN